MSEPSEYVMTPQLQPKQNFVEQQKLTSKVPEFGRYEKQPDISQLKGMNMNYF